jgi:hypothetical protein
MKHSFAFDSNKYDFWPLYHAIQKYYPIGIKKHQEGSIYRQYRGIQELEKLLLEKTGPKNANYKKNWVSFIEQIGKALKKKAQGTTFGFAPSHSAYLILDSTGEGDRRNYKELHFAVSHLGQFYQVYGLEKSVRSSVLMHEGEEVTWQTVNLKKIVVSPLGEYRPYFERVENYITEKYKGYRLVPFKIGQTFIDGLQILHLDNENCSINMALFNDFLGLGEQVAEIEPQGNLEYGMDYWKK